MIHLLWSTLESPGTHKNFPTQQLSWCITGSFYA